jgi:putative ABC transport system ATP-binding protein
MAHAPILQFSDVVKAYGAGANEIRALRGISLTIEPGEFVAIMGPSGCGKSTMLHLAGALELPSAGRVLVNGRDVTSMAAAEAAELRRRDVGYVFQRLNLIPALTAIENVMLPPESAPPRRSRASASIARSIGTRTTSPADNNSASPSPARS